MINGFFALTAGFSTGIVINPINTFDMILQQLITELLGIGLLIIMILAILHLLSEIGQLAEDFIRWLINKPVK